MGYNIYTIVGYKTIPWEGLKDMYYIYCYTNKLNGHRYVGQTNNIQRRQREHKSTSYNPKSTSYNDLIHKKMRQYGYENFDFEVLEIIYSDDIEVVNAQEQFWVKKLDTYCGHGHGYNMDLGGGQPEHSRIISKKDIGTIKTLLKNKEPFIDIQKRFDISAAFISAINHGVYYYDDQETYPLCKYYKDDSDYDELINLLANTDIPLAEIARQLEMGYSTVKKINAGTLRHGLYPTYPIRKKNHWQRASERQQLARQLLLQGKTKEEVANITGYNPETVRQINKGERWKDDSLQYPLNNL